MKIVFKPGSRKEYRRVVEESDLAAFHGQSVHPVCSTFSIARDFEWTSRLFFLEMKDEDEEGVGIFVSVEHKSPAFAGDEIVYTATFGLLKDRELTCLLEAHVGETVIATGTTGQKMMKKELLKMLFAKKP